MTSDKNTKGNEFYFEDQRQLSIYNHLKRLVGPGAASFYKDACRFMASPDSFEATTHLIAHCLREVQSSLIGLLSTIGEEDILDEDLESKKEILVVFLEKLEVSESTIKGIEATFTGKEQTSFKKKVDQILKELEIPADSSITAAWHEILGSKGHKIAHRNNLDPVRPMDRGFDEYWEAINEGLLGILQKFDIHFIRFIKVIDNLAKIEHPTSANVTYVKTKLPNNYVIYDYLFSKIESPEWLGLLHSRGFFASPPPVIFDSESNTTFAAKWPVLNYLKRMASANPEQVVDILLNIPYTDNDNAKLQLLQVVECLPYTEWSKLAERIKTWMIDEDHFLLNAKAVDLIKLVSEKGDTSFTFDLIRHFLMSFPNSTESPRQQRKRTIDNYRYTKFLHDDFAAIVGTEVSAGLGMLVDSLEAYYGPSSDDYGWFTRRSIEIREGFSQDSISDELIDAIFRFVNEMLKTDPSALKSIIDTLSSKNHPVFSRICLYLISKYHTTEPGLAVKFLWTKKFITEHYYNREYALLAHASFPNLSQEEKQTLLKLAIKPNNAEKKKIDAYYKGSEAGVEVFQLDRLAIFVPYLFDEFDELYHQLVAKHGEPLDPKESRMRERSFYGPRSHVTAGDISSMDHDSLIQLLTDWSPSGEEHGPTYAGLGAEISSAVKQKPEALIKLSERMIGLEPTYIKSYLQGLSEVVQRRTPVEWVGLMKLFIWVLEQPREIPGREGVDIFDQDKDWGGSRMAIISLISNGLNFEAIPIDLRDIVWGIIEILTKDPDPSPEDELTREGEPRDDAYSITINSVRGEAINSVIEYASWLSDQKMLNEGDYLENIKRVLEEHLEDSSIGVRAAYGHYFGLLLFLDKEWSLNHVNDIFPLDKADSRLYHAAWSTYLLYGRPSRTTFDLLIDHYRHALKSLPSNQDEKDVTYEQKHLAHHIIDMLWNGKINMNDSQNVLSIFFQHASDHLRSEAIKNIGLSLTYLDDSPIEGKIRKRIISDMQLLWEVRIAEAEASVDKQLYKEEIGAFSKWFLSGKFDDKWLQNQLLRSLDICRSLHDGYFLLEALDTFSDKDPVGVHEILAKLITNGNFFGEEGHVRSIIKKGLDSSEASVRKSTLALISLLISHDHSSYTDLVPPQE